MKLDKKDILEALEIVKPGLANTEMIKQSTSYVFKDDRVITYNDSIGMSHPIKGLDIKGAVKAEEMFEFLKRLKMDEVEVKITDNELLFKSGHAKAGLNLHSKIELPLAEVEGHKDWIDLPEDFLVNLDFTKDSCGSDMVRRKLTCVHATNMMMEASDGFRLIRAYTAEHEQEFDILIPRENIPHILRMNPIQWCQTEGFIHFKNAEGTELNCRILNANYPNTSKIFEWDGNEIVFPDEMDEILEKATVFAKGDNTFDSEIEVKLKKGKLLVIGKNDYGWFKEPAKVKYKGKAVSFKIAPYLLKNILDRSNTGILSDSVLCFRGEDWEYAATLKAE